MENPYDHTDFEDFLKEQADQYRLYPSDQTWRRIQHQIHGHKKWPALTTISVLVISLLVVGSLIIKPEIKTSILAVQQKTNTQTTSAGQNATDPSITTRQADAALTGNLAINNITLSTMASVTETLQSRNADFTNAIVFNDKNNFIVKDNSLIAENLLATAKNGNTQLANAINDPSTNSEKHNQQIDLFDFALKTISQPYALAAGLNFAPNNDLQNTGAPYYFRYAVNSYSTSSDIDEILENSRSSYAYRPFKNTISKFDFQFYLTPSVSYRRLTDNQQGKAASTYVSALSLATSPFIFDVNKMVSHKPAIGYELGFALGYKLSDRFTLKTGLQFNMDQYYIDAYLYSADVAPVMDENVPTVFSPFLLNRTIAPSTPFTLKNRYYQLSIPVGLDYKILEKGKLSWNVATSVQPTYTFDKEPFVVSTNFKDFADGSKLMRNWNVNGNVETYLSYKTGSVKWQVGPQFRYQFLPSMSNDYPIKEYLLNYGLKIGFTKTIK